MDPGAGGRRAEDDAQRVGAVGVADGQLGVVGAHRAGADEDGVGLGSEAVDVGAGLGSGDPAATSRRAAAVRPSRVAASFSTTKGRPVRRWWR